MNQLADPALIAANVREIKARAGAAPITHALVLGTGLGEAFRQLPHSISIDYADLPGFPASSKSGATISGHAGPCPCLSNRQSALQGRAFGKFC